MAIHQKLFLLLLVLLPTQLGLHFWPDWAFVLGRRVDYLSPTLFMTDLIIGLLLLSWGVDSRPAMVIRRNQKVGIGIFLSFVVINILVAKSKPVAFYSWAKALEYLLLVIYIVRTKPNFSHVAFSLSIAAFYSSIIALLQFYFQRSLGGVLWFVGERAFTVSSAGIARIPWCMTDAFGCTELLRAYGTFPHPNVLGGFLAVAILFVVGQLLVTPPSHRRTLFGYWTTLFISLAALGTTFSRSALVAFVFGAVAVCSTHVVVRYKKIVGRYKGIFVGVAVAFVFFVFVLRPTLTEESVVVRSALVTSSFTLWGHHPLFGVGLGNFLVMLPQALPQRQVYFLQPVHNIYALLLSEIGIVGMALAIYIAVWFLRFVVPMRKVERKQRLSYIVVSTALLTLLLLGCIDHYPLTLQQGQLLLTVVIGLLGTFGTKKIHPRQASPTS